MNILFLAIDINIKSRAGDAVHVRELVGALANLGHKVDLIVAHTEECLEELNSLRTQQNVRIFFNKPKRYFKNLSTLSFCKKVAREGKAEVIYERRFSPKMGYLLRKILKVPYIVEINGLAEIEAKIQGILKKQNVVVRRIKKRIRRRFFIHAGKIVAVTGGIRENLVTEYNLPTGKIVVVPNGANINLFRKIDKMKCRQQLGLDKHKKYICFTGSLSPWQGVIHMVNAMPHILKEMPNVRFLVVGAGQEKKELEKRAKELNVEKQIIFAGWVEYEKVPKYINASDVCVAPLTIGREKSGSSAIKIYEYLACGKPVVAFDVPDIEFLEKYGCGILVPRDNVAALTGAILKLLSNDPLGEKIGETGRKIVVENYSWANTAKRISELMENLV